MEINTFTATNAALTAAQSLIGSAAKKGDTSRGRLRATSRGFETSGISCATQNNNFLLHCQLFFIFVLMGL
jgi:hypothetical protein